MDPHSPANPGRQWSSKPISVTKAEDAFSNKAADNSNVDLPTNSPSNSQISHHNTPDNKSDSTLPFGLRAPSRRTSSVMGHIDSPDNNNNNNNMLNGNGYKSDTSQAIMALEKNQESIDPSYLQSSDPPSQDRSPFQARSQARSQTQRQSQSPSQSQLRSNFQTRSHTQTKPSTQSRAPTKSTKKRKVDKACVYCRRSHMTCDIVRPCQRCINRNIGHLCHDQTSISTSTSTSTSISNSTSTSTGSEHIPSTTVAVAATASSSNSGLSVIKNNDNAKISSVVDLGSVSGGANISANTNGAYSQSPMAYSSSTDPTAARTMGTTTSAASVESVGSAAANSVSDSSTNMASVNHNSNNSLADWGPLNQQSILFQTIGYNQNPVFYSEQAGSEFSSLNEFLSMIDDSSYDQVDNNDQNNNNNNNNNHDDDNPSNLMASLVIPDNYSRQGGFHGDNNGLSVVDTTMNLTNNNHGNVANLQNIHNTNGYTTTTNNNNNGGIAFEPDNQQPRVSQAARDKFFLTAADPSVNISPEERLKQVISAKLEAGLLQPFNYVRGYARLQKYMDYYMNQSSRQRILQPISNIRPAFRAIAQSLHDVDLVLVEEAFERMLLDYDRVFTSMAIPACLWRRTGEIYRGNKEFAGLVEVSVDDLRDGKLAIYELMSEESAVNFWEKYGQIAFDSSQKAILTVCSLRTKDGRKRKACCFSFTIRRDRYNIPSCIVGNFIPIHL